MKQSRFVLADMACGDEKDRSALADRMREARTRGVVALQSYNVLRSKVPDGVIIALEGGDDPIFYATTIQMVRPAFGWSPLVCNGKDHVLGLRELLDRNLGRANGKTFFVVDKDFDGLKGHAARDDTYCTPGYSFENIIVSEEVLHQLLIGEFRCQAMGEDIQAVLTCFQRRLCEFFAAIKLANQALHYCRSKGLRAGSVENKIGKYVKVTLDGVNQQYTEEDLPKLVGFPTDADAGQITETCDQFEKLRPHEDWRGKYLMGFFVEFLSHLKEDRCKRSPELFSSKKSISFDPRSSTVRILSSIAGPPECLREFVVKMAA